MNITKPSQKLNILALVLLVLVIIILTLSYSGETKAFFWNSKATEKFIYMCNTGSGLPEAHAGQRLIDGAAENGWTFVQMTPGPCAVFKKNIN